MLSNFPFSAVLWDMDGTLIDSEPLWIEQERQLMESFGASWSHSDAIHCIGGPMSRVDAYMRSRLPDEHRDSVEPFELARQLLERMEIRLAQNVPFTPGSFEIITEMKSAGLPLALVSASTRPLMNAALKSIGEKLFDVTISDTEVSQSKPHPEGYLMAANSLAVDINSCLIIEDSITGMNAAIASGAYVLGLPHVADLPRGEKVVHRLSLEGLSLSEIPGLFDALLERQ